MMARSGMVTLRVPVSLLAAGGLVLTPLVHPASAGETAPTVAVSPVIVATIAVGQLPGTPLLDATTHHLYVPNLRSDSITVVDTSTNSVAGTIHLTSSPWIMGLAPIRGHLYVQEGSNSVTVIDTTTNSAVSSIRVGKDPTDAVIDVDKGRLIVLNGTSSSISVINTATNSVTATIKVTPPGSELALDAGLGLLYTDYNTARGMGVSVISIRSNRVIGHISTPRD
ncbi:MAG: YncE family protein, partial [Actinomycetota bacterium]|nr:YncE family protein [Actinomycetota bacterium]